MAWHESVSQTLAGCCRSAATVAAAARSVVASATSPRTKCAMLHTMCAAITCSRSPLRAARSRSSKPIARHSSTVSGAMIECARPTSPYASVAASPVRRASSTARGRALHDGRARGRRSSARQARSRRARSAVPGLEVGGPPRASARAAGRHRRGPHDSPAVAGGGRASSSPSSALRGCRPRARTSPWQPMCRPLDGLAESEQEPAACRIVGAARCREGVERRLVEARRLIVGEGTRREQATVSLRKSGFPSVRSLSAATSSGDAISAAVRSTFAPMSSWLRPRSEMRRAPGRARSRRAARRDRR